MTARSFSPPDGSRQPAFVGRPPVGEEGAAYCVVRRYLWPDLTAPTPGEGDSIARTGAPASTPPARPRP